MAEYFVGEDDGRSTVAARMEVVEVVEDSSDDSDDTTEGEDSSAEEGLSDDESDDSSASESDDDLLAYDESEDLLIHGRPESHLGLARSLLERGAFQEESVLKALERVDRSRFVPDRVRDCSFDDAPLRCRDERWECVVHLSAPSIYASALEALELGPGPHKGASSVLHLSSV